MKAKLQIISGKYRGRKLALPSDARPTQNKARIALFNMLNDVRPNVVWDAFAGSGAFGIEWLSRTDADVIFTDTSPDSVRTIKKNLGDARATVQQIDAIAAIKKYGANADLIFIDPPYSDAELGAAFVRKLTLVAKPGAILVWEMEKDHPGASPHPSIGRELGWTLLKDKTYGRARFLILQKNLIS